MILTVSGWRDWSKHCDDEFVRQHFGRVLNFWDHKLEIRVGDADGVDKIIRNMCSRLGLPCTVYYADWVKEGRKAAGPLRNGRMLRGEGNRLDPNPDTVTDQLLAFPQPGVTLRSPGSGTLGCALDAHQLGVNIVIPGYRDVTEERK